MSYAMLLALLLAQDARVTEIEKKVRRVVDEHFSLGTDAAAREEYARKVAAPLLACKDPARVDVILRHLPKAADYHRTVIDWEFRFHQDIPPGLAGRDDLLKEGTELHVEYLAVRTARAAGREWTQEKIDRIQDQIDTLFRTAREVLAEKVRGEAADELMGRTVEQTRIAWRGSLLLPFNSCLDAPLPEKDLQRVLQEIRDRAEDFKPVTMTAEDLAGERAWEKSAAAKLVGDVIETCYRATQACFAEFTLLEERVKAWKKKVKDAREKASKKEK